MKRLPLILIAVTTLTVPPSSATAENNYVFGSLGMGGLSDSDNTGSLNSDFTTGTGTTIPLGTPLPKGTPVEWNTEFDGAVTFAFGAGRYFTENIRGEFEIGLQSSDVSTHSNVKAAGINLSDEDAAVLITGSPALGATVGTIVKSGEGEIKSNFFMVNGFYDIDLDAPVNPYLGAGLGFAQTRVRFNPSGVDIIDDTQTSFAWQIMGGLNWEINETVTAYLGGRYRATTDVEVDVDLFPANLDIKNSGMSVETGLRIMF